MSFVHILAFTLSRLSLVINPFTEHGVHARRYSAHLPSVPSPLSLSSLLLSMEAPRPSAHRAARHLCSLRFDRFMLRRSFYRIPLSLADFLAYFSVLLRSYLITFALDNISDSTACRVPCDEAAVDDEIGSGAAILQSAKRKTDQKEAVARRRCHDYCS